MYIYIYQGQHPLGYKLLFYNSPSILTSCICMCTLPSCEQKVKMMLNLLSHLPFALFILIQYGMAQKPPQPCNGKTSAVSIF